MAFQGIRTEGFHDDSTALLQETEAASDAEQFGAVNRVIVNPVQSVHEVSGNRMTAGVLRAMEQFSGRRSRLAEAALILILFLFLGVHRGHERRTRLRRLRQPGRIEIISYIHQQPGYC